MSNFTNKATLIKTAVVTVWVGMIAVTDHVMAHETPEQQLATWIEKQNQLVAEKLVAETNHQLKASLGRFEMDLIMDQVTLDMQEQMVKAEPVEQATTAKAEHK